MALLLLSTPGLLRLALNSLKPEEFLTYQTTCTCPEINPDPFITVVRVKMLAQTIFVKATAATHGDGFGSF